MGREARCEAEHGGRRAAGRALLEASELVFRGEDLRFRIPLGTLRRVEAADGWLEVDGPGGAARLALGDDAARWAERIRNPPSVLDKLGIRPGTAVSVRGEVEEELLAQVRSRASVVPDPAAAAVILLPVGSQDELAGLGALRPVMGDDAALWVVWPKGRREIGEGHVRAAALAAGLVDVKVASVSDRSSALKLVVPRARRAPRRPPRKPAGGRS